MIARLWHFEMLTLWHDGDTIKLFAAEDYANAKYYDFDSEYLVEVEPGVRHYEVYQQSLPGAPRCDKSKAKKFDTHLAGLIESVGSMRRAIVRRFRDSTPRFFFGLFLVAA
jgi:hypothetical protein